MEVNYNKLYSSINTFRSDPIFWCTRKNTHVKNVMTHICEISLWQHVMPHISDMRFQDISTSHIRVMRFLVVTILCVTQL